MSTIETLVVTDEWTTLDLLLFRRFQREYQGLTEATLELNRDLEESGPYLPLGAQVKVAVPQVSSKPITTTVIRLMD